MSVDTESRAAGQEFSREAARKAFLGENATNSSISSTPINELAGNTRLAADYIKALPSFKVTVIPGSEGTQARGVHESGALVHVDTSKNGRPSTPPTLLMELPSGLTIEELPDTIRTHVSSEPLIPDTKNVVLPLEGIDVFRSEEATTLVYDTDQTTDGEPRTVGYVKLTATDVELGSTVIHYKEAIGVDKNGEVIGVRQKKDKEDTSSGVADVNPGYFDWSTADLLTAPKLTRTENGEVRINGQRLPNHEVSHGPARQKEIFSRRTTDRRPTMSQNGSAPSTSNGHEPGYFNWSTADLLTAPKLTRTENGEIRINGQRLPNHATPPGGGRGNTR